MQEVWKSFGIAISAGLLLVAVPGVALGSVEIVAVSTTVAHDHTRIVLESDGPIRFTLAHLRHPPRLALDLDGVEVNAVLRRLEGGPGRDHPYLGPVRVVQSGPGTISLEVGLKSEAQAQISTRNADAGPGEHLVLEIHPATQMPRPTQAGPQQAFPARIEERAPHPAVLTTRLGVPPPGRALAMATPPITPATSASVNGASLHDPPAHRPPEALASESAEGTAPRAPAGPPPATAANPASPPRTPPAMEALDAEEAWLAVRINGQDTGDTVLVLQRGDDGAVLVAGEDLRRWRLHLPAVAPVEHGGATYYPLDVIPGLSYQVDASTQTLHVEAAPARFETTTLALARPGLREPPLSPPPGGFLNYDLLATRSRDQTTASGLFELGVFGPWGIGLSNFVARAPGDDSPLVRLDTTWTLDRPEQIARLRLGDAISRAGSWGRSVRFGGIQWGTDFTVQPGFVTFPQPGLRGEAVLPSTVDVYVNDALRMRRDVPSGPFSLLELPVVTGRGEAHVVVRDLLGREQVLSVPFHVSPRLLRAGLHDYSYELGLVREDFGIASNEYGRAVAVATHRLGLSDRLTGEVRGELLQDQRTLGVAGAWLWPELGVFTGTVAGSDSDRGAGALLTLGFERQARRVSFGGNVRLTTEAFSQLGLPPEQFAPQRLAQAFVTLATRTSGSFALRYTQQAFRDQEDLKLVNASYSLGLGRLGFLSFSMLRFLAPEPETIYSAIFTRSLGRRTSASVSASAQGDTKEGQVQVQRSLPVGSGFGYRLRAGAADSDLREAAFSARSNVGTYTLEAGRAQRQTVLRASASGGAAWLGGSAFLSRRITDSFAVVEVPDHPGVRIYANNQPVAVTGADGRALVPQLRAYEGNLLRIEQADLPLDTQVDAVEIEAVPAFRSGMQVRFPIKRSHGALVIVVLENGKPLPAGAVAQIAGAEEQFPVGLRGEVYLTGLAADNQVRLRWQGRECEIALAFPETTDPLPHLGTHVCTGVRP
jgi:outer membrane usher protein